MKKFFLSFCFVIGFSLLCFSQGTLKGKIYDETGQTVVGATILIKGTTIGVTTDLDGNYSLKIADDAKKTIVISFISYKTIEFPVAVKNNETIVKDFKLQNDTKDLGTVEIVGRSSKAKEYHMESLKMKSSVSLDYISSETMKKTGDANISSAVARVSGVSTTSNGILTVRGAGDRFIKTNMNGLRIPTLDPLTNNLKLDMFPSSLIDNVILVKTASPDLPGDWAAAYISVETKDYPDNLQVNVETTLGYNPQSTFKDYISTEKSSTDWLGFDNGYRAHDHNKNPTIDHTTKNSYLIVEDKNRYYEFTALGLQDYFNSIGVTSKNYEQNSDQYTKLALIELGFLSKASFNDYAAFDKAKKDFLASGMRQKAYIINNQKYEDDNLSFKNNFNTRNRKAPLNFSQTFSVGNQVKIFKKPLGILFGLRYNSVVVSDQNATGLNPFTGAHDNNIILENHNYSTQNISREVNGWNILLNANYKLNKNNSIGLLFMPNITGINNVRHSRTENVNPDLSPDNKIDNNFRKEQFYESRRQFIYQLKMEHYIPVLKMKIDFNASYTKGKNDLPDFKRLRYTAVYRPELGAADSIRLAGVGQEIERNFRLLNENVFDSKIAFEIPLPNKNDKPTGKIKFGGAYQFTNRENLRYRYIVNYGETINEAVTDDDLHQYFNADYFKIYNSNDGNSAFKNYLTRYNTPVNRTFGKSDVKAVFAMIDYNLLKQMRVSGGLRVEQFIALADVFLFDSLHYKRGDVRRMYQSENLLVFLANPSYKNEVNYLPSVNFIYQLNKNNEKPVNIRLNYSKTIARASLRELLDVSYFDYEFNNDVKGNPDLKTVQVNNYDARFESYFMSGDNLSMSVFYKDMIDMVQLIAVENVGFSWFNSPGKSYVSGIELEGKKKLSQNFDVRANVTFVNSKSPVYNSYRRSDVIGAGNAIVFGDSIIQKPLFGQSPYVINTILSYNSDSLGLSVSVSYNVQGPKLSVLAPDIYRYDIYEMPRHLIDLKVSKTLSKHFSVSLNIKDLLNSPIRRAAKYDDRKGFYTDIYFDKYRFGSIYQLSLSYKI